MRQPLLLPSFLLFLLAAPSALANPIEPAPGSPVSPAPATPADAVLVKAESLLAQRQSQAAYALLAPLEDERADDAEFNHLLGRAALDTGRATQAAFALERCLAIAPTHGPCRVHMARAHMALGETASARKEFLTIQAYNPPADVAAQVSQFLGGLEQQEKTARRQVSAYAQLGLGHDSNVNSATDQSRIAIPLFGGAVFTLDPAGVEQDDLFASLQGGVALRQAVSPAWSLLADASLGARQHDEMDRYDSLVLDLGAGAAWRAGPSQVIVKLQGQQYQLDQEDFRQAVGGMAQYLYAPNESTQLSTYLQATDISYDEQPLRDALRSTLGVAWSQGLSLALRPVLYASLYGGMEDPKASNVERFGQQFFGLRAGGSLRTGTHTQINAALSVEEREFDATDFTFGVTREESQYDVNLGLSHNFTSRFSLRPAYTYTRNDSNIVINDFTRHVLSMSVRYEW